MQWPGTVPAGKVYDKPVISLDMYATVLAQLKQSFKTKHPLDGVNLVPFLTGKKTGAPHETLFWRHYDMKSYAALSADGKKLWMKGDSTVLYDLGTNPREAKNIADEHPALVIKMKQQLLDWEKGLKPPAFLGLSQRDAYIKSKGL